jgi:hypothetical protein
MIRFLGQHLLIQSRRLFQLASLVQGDRGFQ